jgi:predicted nucleotidyltransferase
VTSPDRSVQEILDALQERAKELNCLYAVDDLVHRRGASVDEILHGVIDALPSGWQYPSICRARITYMDKVIQPPDFHVTPWVQRAELDIEGQVVGAVEVYYGKPMPSADEGPFLKEERRLLDTIADRLAFFLMQRRLRGPSAPERGSEPKPEWWAIIDFLRRTDHALLRHISRKVINCLTWQGIPEARDLLQRFAPLLQNGDLAEDNRPTRRTAPGDFLALSEEAFTIAAKHLSDEETIAMIHRWIKDDKSNFLLEVLENQHSSLADIADAIDRYEHLEVPESDLSRTVRTAMRVALTRRILTDRVEYINIAKGYVDVNDFYPLVRQTIALPGSHGKLGGKSAGLFLADHIVRKSGEYADVLQGIRIPKTWYVTSDAQLDFIRHNDLEDLYDRKYMEIEQIRLEYPNVVQLFKNSPFSPEMIRGLSAAMDHLEGRPMIVRSSSLLEDQMGAAFSGKYKSLFLANTGPKAERLASLMDAIAEVYASVFAPDPIAYRAERGMLDLHEEMGIMIQEVVGTRVGKYYFPSFAGVAFSNNEFRWSPRIRREDGLVRLVAGLGTRAVDRLADDYTVLVSPGQPGLRVNVTPDEIVRYSPKRIDVIDMESGAFTTLDVTSLLRECGDAYPGLRHVVSIAGEDGTLRSASFDADLEREHPVITFEGLVSGTPFMNRMRALLEVLREKMGTPVDIEFASDGRDLFLLQCRPQSFAGTEGPAQIPRDIPRDRLVFSAHRYVSNGRVPDVTHIVYVDPEAYATLHGLEDLKDVGRVVGRLNKLLPKRQFVLIGPGRWGSRGDIKLGVSVTYSDISNAAVLIEVARRKGHYLPELSFGTHFFQDLVEASIRYLPLYPDDPGTHFDEAFLKGSPNLLDRMLPEYAHLGRVVRVIDVPDATGGNVLQVLMNADLDEAVGVLAAPGTAPPGTKEEVQRRAAPPAEETWRWRLRMAERIAEQIDPQRYGVAALYVFGSTKNATAGPGSDIDLLVHFRGTLEQRGELLAWLDGWGRCLAEMNYLRTGLRSQNLLDVHLVTDEDIARRTSYAAKIGAVTDAARPLTMRPAAGGGAGPVEP